jgi:hypothetical protein
MDLGLLLNLLFGWPGMLLVGWLLLFREKEKR